MKSIISNKIIIPIEQFTHEKSTNFGEVVLVNGIACEYIDIIEDTQSNTYCVFEHNDKAALEHGIYIHEEFEVEYNEEIIMNNLTNLPSVIFPEGNSIQFWQDFRGKEGIPSDRKFYLERRVNNKLFFIADGYGILKNNKWKLKGDYGNGGIMIQAKDLPLELQEKCRLV